MPIPKLCKSSTFRLALIYMGLFSVSVLVLLGFIYWSTAGYMVRQTEATIEVEIAGLADRYALSGLPGLSQVINERLDRQTTKASLYLLTDAQYKPIIGNLEKWPQTESSTDGWLSFHIKKGEKTSDGQRKALARAFPLQGDFHLLVGRDVHDLAEIQTLIQEALFWGLIITILLALAGGTMMSRTVMHRIEMINDTCHRIIDGDLTQRITTTGADDDFDKLVDTLNQMLDQIEHLMQGVKQVTNNIAHDLRTPLSRLRRRLDMLRGNDLEVGLRDDLLEQAISEADGLLMTFKALLRISEVETGTRRGGFERVDVATLLDDVIDLYLPLSEEKGQTIEVKRGQIQPLQGDRDLLFQAFANVLDNAIKYTPPGGTIRLSSSDKADLLKVSISDSGLGIPASAHAKVFERFYRLETSRSPPGNGLGLSLVAAIVHLHHGHIQLADNQPGLTLAITLPRFF